MSIKVGPGTNGRAEAPRRKSPVVKSTNVQKQKPTKHSSKLSPRKSQNPFR